MKKAQARANILSQDPAAPQQQQQPMDQRQQPGFQQPFPGQNASNVRYPPPNQRQPSSGYRQKPPPQQAYYNQFQQPVPQMQHPEKSSRQGYQPHPDQQHYNQGYNDYPQQGQHHSPTGSYQDNRYQQQQRNYSQPAPQQHLPPQMPRHSSHDAYHYRDQGHSGYQEDYGYNNQQYPQNNERATSYQGPPPQNYQGRPVTADSAKSSEEQSKIMELEEKIQKLEKLMTLKGESNTSIPSPTSDLHLVTEQTSQMNINEPARVQTTTTAPVSINGAPPLPPPPPTEQRSISSSPKANLFTTELESSTMKSNTSAGATSHNDPLRMSTSSLIPTDRSISDQSIDDQDDQVDEPPPSYEELEKLGTLTYSKSIYRTGFEKAGYQLDHVQPSPSTPAPNTHTERLMSKRRIPSEIKEERKEEESSNMIPIRESTPPAPRKSPEPIEVSPQDIVKSRQQPKRFTDDSLYGAEEIAPKPVKGNFIKYQTPVSFKTLNHDIIEPILPSKSDEPEDSIIQRFRTTRDQALRDYSQFTPKIQFFWAILLLETMSNQKVLSRMAIDGKIRKTPLQFKNLGKQRSMFLNTAVKVLEKLIQIAPDETRAKLYLGDIYSGGIHPGIIERDEKKGFQYFMEASLKQNDPVACYRVACCLESGVGCTQDVLKSTEFFQMGAKLGDPSSMCQLGMMHFAGVNGCSQDINQSIQYHKDAYETLRSKTIMSFDPLISVRSYQDARGAFYTLAKIYQTDRNILCLNDGSPKSIRMVEQMKNGRIWCHSSRALKYYLEAAKLGHSESQASLGYYYSQGFFPTLNFKSDKEAHNGNPDPLDTRKSIYWFSKAASDGHVYASLGLARWYGSGAEGVMNKDEQQAFLWGRKAADIGGLPEAEFMIGMCFETGFGTNKNRSMAINYYERSANKGYKKARDKLKTL